MESLLAPFDRTFFDPSQRFKVIGTGSLGGKAHGLAVIQDILAMSWDNTSFPGIDVSIPSLTVIRTDVFDAFLTRNELHKIAYADEDDSYKAYAFQKAALPAEILGDLRALVEQVHTPLAVRSSSLLEDALSEPFAGVYETKMIPNNQPSVDERFRRLSEAVKFVYASTFFRSARDYVRATSHRTEDEKMAVILQEVVGSPVGDRFYPNVSGVARSYNFYAMGRARPEDGVVSLALGLGKTIVDGGKCWTYSPAYPMIAPPYRSSVELVKSTQSTFWAVNMGKPPAYDPINEREYLVEGTLQDAEEDGRLQYIASTYDPASDSRTPGTSRVGIRVLDFSMLLASRELPVNQLVRNILAVCAESVGAPLEAEFAMTFDPPRFGFLQARPMVVSQAEVTLTEADLRSDRTRIRSGTVLGNGIVDTISDIVYVKPEMFATTSTRAIADELADLNNVLTSSHRPYILIGFGRWGSADPFLGIPVAWGQISGAQAIVEASIPDLNIDFSQGSHFFHNLTSFHVSYFCIRSGGSDSIDWQWLQSQRIVNDRKFTRHITLPNPLTLKVDGRSGTGMVASHE